MRPRLRALMRAPWPSASWHPLQKEIPARQCCCLADGTVFYGRSCGAAGTATGEVCFNTSLEGYFEVMTDPSYAGQIVTMTYPQIGNYGIDLADVQSAFPGDGSRPANAPAMRAMVVRDMVPHAFQLA